MTAKIPLLVLTVAALFSSAYAHSQELELEAPLDAILYLHMGLQALIWGVLFPIGMVLGLARSRWHVPLQTLAFALTFAGIILGHAHGGRQFPRSMHGKLGSWLLVPIVAQLVLGIYLKLHVHERTFRPYALRAHGILGCAWPMIGWVQSLFGVIVLRGFCGEVAVPQCAGHYMMGSGLIAWGISVALLLVVSERQAGQSGRSPEWWDSWVITLFGIVNTLTMHHGGAWPVKDMQHVSLGVVLWAGGALGIYLSYNNQRHVVSGLMFILTGWVLSEHAQALKLSTKVHSMFGYTLMLAGLARIIDICFIIAKSSARVDNNENEHASTSPMNVHSSETKSKAKAVPAFRHLFPSFLVASGFLLMSATDEELKAVYDMGMDHVTYVLGMYSLAILLYLFTIFLSNLYITSGRNADTSKHGADVVFFAPANGEIELADPRGTSKWYVPVPMEEGAVRALGDEEE